MVDKLAIYQLVIAGFQASTTYEDDKPASEWLFNELHSGKLT